MNNFAVFVCLLPLLLSGCAFHETPILSLSGFDYRLAAEREGGFVMLFNFTVFNNSSADARGVFVQVDGLNRTPPETNHYGLWKRTIPLIPAGRNAVVTGKLESIESCDEFGPGGRECMHGETYFTITVRPKNGPELVRVVPEYKGY